MLAAAKHLFSICFKALRGGGAGRVTVFGRGASAMTPETFSQCLVLSTSPVAFCLLVCCPSLAEASAESQGC